MLTLVILGAVFVTSLWFSTWSLGLSGKLLRVQRVGFLRRFLAVLAITLIDVGVVVFHNKYQPLDQQAAAVRAVIFMTIILLSTWVLIRVGMRVGWGWSLLVLLVWLFFQTVYSTATILGTKQYLAEAFVIPSNNMGPTLAGPHVRGTCPHCGQDAMLPGYLHPHTRLFTLSNPWLGEEKPPALVESICFSCLRIGKTAPVAGPMEPLDRILVNRLLKPRRWDLLVFRYPKEQEPEEPPKIYVVRLVGFPGEEVAIKQGAVWIDGVKLDPPESIAGLQYLSRPDLADREVPFEVAARTDDGRGFEPVKLSSKGYFVLGDLTTRSSDSRDWGEVPEENILGVASVIYWPPKRWRILR